MSTLALGRRVYISGNALVPVLQPLLVYSLSFITVEDAIGKILELGPHTLLGKVDMKSAFRLLPAHPADRSLLAIQWGGCLPFGLRSAPKLFNIMADLLS